MDVQEAVGLADKYQNLSATYHMLRRSIENFAEAMAEAELPRSDVEWPMIAVSYLGGKSQYVVTVDVVIKEHK